MTKKLDWVVKYADELVRIGLRTSRIEQQPTVKSERCDHPPENRHRAKFIVTKTTQKAFRVWLRAVPVYEISMTRRELYDDLKPGYTLGGVGGLDFTGAETEYTIACFRGVERPDYVFSQPEAKLIWARTLEAYEQKQRLTKRAKT